jgi:hypothetical protein
MDLLMNPSGARKTLPYSSFTVGQIKEDFGISIQEGRRFLPIDLPPIPPSVKLLSILEDVPWAIAVGTEKARSEVIINPVLLEVRRYLQQQVSVFSGEEFNVDAAIGLNGVCDFLISRSPEQLVLEAPILVLVEAKKADLKLGLGQCMAEMIAAQRFNHQKNRSINTIFGVVTSGTQWRLMQLTEQVVVVDLQDYSLEPIGQLLAMLVWMATQS